MKKLDFRHMNPPFLRVHDRHVTPASDEVIEWDLRVAVPNSAQVPAAILHTLEHLLDVELKSRNPLVTHVGPRGSHTGLSITAINIGRYSIMAGLMADALTAVTAAHAIPDANSVHCGAEVMHNLPGARELAHRLFAARATWSEPLECATPS